IGNAIIIAVKIVHIRYAVAVRIYAGITAIALITVNYPVIVTIHILKISHTVAIQIPRVGNGRHGRILAVGNWLTEMIDHGLTDADDAVVIIVGLTGFVYIRKPVAVAIQIAKIRNAVRICVGWVGGREKRIP